MIRKIDANDDGQVSFKEKQNEWPNRKQANMVSKLDDNADDFVFTEEFEELKDHRHGKLFRFFPKDQKDDGHAND